MRWAEAQEKQVKKIILCCVLLAFCGIGIAQSPAPPPQPGQPPPGSTSTEFDLALHCAGPGPINGSASVNIEMTGMNPGTQPLTCSDTTSRGDTQHFILSGTLVGFSGQVNASGTGMIQGCAFAGTSLPFEITCEDTSSSPTRRVRFSIR